MGITSKHPQFEDYEDVWDKCEAFVEGEKSVKDEGDEYLPRLSGQSNLQYESYKQRAWFYNAAGRTVAGLVGSIFRKEPSIVVPEKMSYIVQDATGTGTSLVELLMSVVKEQLTTGRIGLLADRVGTSRPYIVVYDADDIINWRMDISEKFIVLEEDIITQGEDKFDLVESEQYRELFIDQDGFYCVNVWQEVKDAKTGKSNWSIVNTVYPTQNGRKMDYLPFVCITPDGLDMEVVKPPVADLVDVQEKHYMLSADLANALHICGTPTPYVTGVPAEDDQGNAVVFGLGATNAWVLPDTGCRAGFLEFSGQGVKPMQDAMSKLEGMMAALGAKLVEVSKISTGVETAEGVRTREAAASAVLSSIITSVESGVTEILRSIARWEGLPTDGIQVKLNRDLIQPSLDANMLNALSKALQDGTISPETFYHNLAESGMLPADSDFETEQKRIADYGKNKQVLPTQNVAVA